ncbi:MAG TPA: hypothetical protein VM841_10510 [Actinomycetota bacterium]|nr:hypothetical protein [Actinomycetota bacterium]
MPGTIETAGERIRFDVAIGWVADLVEESTGSPLAPGSGDETLRVVVERDRKPFPGDWDEAGRALARRDREVVIRNAAQSGFDLLVHAWHSPPELIFRWRPGIELRAFRAFPARWRLRLGAMLTQYPALWRASTAARPPLHAACVRIDQGTALVVGMPGAGTSTVLAAEMAAGALPITDNLCVADARTVWGVAEPFRIEPWAVPDDVIALPTTRGRMSVVPETRLPSARPDVVVLLERGRETRVREADPAELARLMVTSTYACGELRRFWPLAATLAMTTGYGPALPPVLPVARALVDRLPCVGVALARPGIRLSDALGGYSARRSVPDARDRVAITR